MIWGLIEEMRETMRKNPLYSTWDEEECDEQFDELLDEALSDMDQDQLNELLCEYGIHQAYYTYWKLENRFPHDEYRVLHLVIMREIKEHR